MASLLPISFSNFDGLVRYLERRQNSYKTNELLNIVRKYAKIIPSINYPPNTSLEVREKLEDSLSTRLQKIELIAKFKQQQQLRKEQEVQQSGIPCSTQQNRARTLLVWNCDNELSS